MAGHDPRESTSLPNPVPDYLEGLAGGVEGLRVGVVTQLMSEGVQPGVRSRIEESIALLTKLGAEVGEVSLPTFDLGIDVPVSFGPNKHQGLDRVYFTTVRSGRFVRLEDWKRWAK